MVHQKQALLGSRSSLMKYQLLRLGHQMTSYITIVDYFVGLVK